MNSPATRAEFAEFAAPLRLRIAELESTLSNTINSFAVTLMVCAEKNGMVDPEKRYDYAERHAQVIAARAVLKGK